MRWIDRSARAEAGQVCTDVASLAASQSYGWKCATRRRPDGCAWVKPAGAVRHTLLGAELSRQCKPIA
jgi:hypothetical protein